MVSAPLQLIHIERAGADRLDEVMAIMLAAFDPQYGEAWTRAQCAGILPMAGVSLALARVADGQPVGFSLFRITAGEAELLLLAVDPAHRRKGVARALLDDFVISARSAGASKVHLEVRENNPAIQIYELAGFSPVGRRRDYYSGKDGARFDALTFARSI